MCAERKSTRRKPSPHSPKPPPALPASDAAPVPWVRDGIILPIAAKLLPPDLGSWLFHRQSARTAQYRRELSRRFHDHLSQQLTALSLELRIAALSPSVSANPPDPASAPDSLFNRLGDLIDHAVEETRSIRRDLHPDLLEAYGLSAALSGLVREYRTRGAWEINARIAEIPAARGGSTPSARGGPAPAGEIVSTLFHAAEELLANAATHAQATHLTLSLDATPGFWRLEIADNGCGLGAARPAYGLCRIIEQARHLGGTLTVATSPKTGTRISLLLPAPAPAPPKNIPSQPKTKP